MQAEQVTPRVAATVLLLRDGALGLEVFMVVRHDAIGFAAGALVFPGGRVDPGDHTLALRGDRCAAAEEDAPVRIASIRETFEEARVFLARRRGAARLLSAAELATVADRYHALLNRGEATLADIVESEDLVLATDALAPYAHWITPADQPRRYDTHFFLAEAPSGQVAAHDGHESVDSVWLTPAAALAGAEAGRYKMVFPTHMNLRKLSRHASVAEALAAARASTVVTVQPVQLREQDGVRVMRIPAEAGYGGEEFAVRLPRSNA